MKIVLTSLSILEIANEINITNDIYTVEEIKKETVIGKCCSNRAHAAQKPHKIHLTQTNSTQRINAMLKLGKTPDGKRISSRYSMSIYYLLRAFHIPLTARIVNKFWLDWNLIVYYIFIINSQANDIECNNITWRMDQFFIFSWFILFLLLYCFTSSQLAE